MRIHNVKKGELTRFFREAASPLRHVSAKKAASITCLLVAAMMLTSMLPIVSGAAQYGVTTIGSTNYPTATFGTSGNGANSGGVANILVATKYTLSSSGTVTKIGGYAGSAGNWKLGIYSDSGGHPGTLLAANNNVNPVVAGDNSFDIGPVYLTAGTYWIAILTDSANRRYSTGSTGQANYILNYGFSNNLPSNFGSSYGTQNNDYVAYCKYVQIEGYAKATKITVSDNNVAISSLSFYSHATGSFRAAIYSDNSGPNSKLWECGDTAATTGWNSVAIASGSPTALTLSSGTYWLIWQWNSVNAGPSYSAGSSGDGQYKATAYDTFPATWSGGTVSSEKWSIYLAGGGLASTPENPLGAVLALAVCFGAFAVFVKSRKSKSAA